MGVVAAMIGGFAFYFRKYMRETRWGILLLAIALHVVMEAPVWHLISRVSAVGGSTGHFRYMLINSAIERFGEWAVFGAKSTANWFFGAQDLCNQYVIEGVQGGVLTLGLFVTVIAIAFREVGMIWRQCNSDRYHLILAWMLGVSLLVHCVDFIGVSYFGQIWIMWYLLLAIIGSLSIQPRSRSAEIKRLPNRQGRVHLQGGHNYECS